MKPKQTETPVAFRWPCRVYWEDTDAGGVVYHAAYLRFMERARSEWLRSLGVDQSQLRAQTGLAMLVRDMQIDFHAPARLDDQLEITAEPQVLRSASMIFAQIVTRREAPVEPLVQARVRIACVDVATMRPAAFPGMLREQMAAASENHKGPNPT